MSTTSTSPSSDPPAPSIFRYTLGFLLVGMAWGLTTPFIRRAALDFHPPAHASLTRLRAAEPSNPSYPSSNPSPSYSSPSSSHPSSQTTTPSPYSQTRLQLGWIARRMAWTWWWLKLKALTGAWTVADLLRSPRYAAPLVVNLTGSVWFFLLIGKAELSLTVPITNSLAFLFTVLGEWWAEGKGIGRDTWLGMACVLGGIALCVGSKSGGG